MSDKKTVPVSLRQVRSEADVIRLRRSHYGWQNWNIMTDGCLVWISRQELGKPRTHEIEIPKRIFDRLLELYERDQSSK